LSEVAIMLPQLNSSQVELHIHHPLHTVTGNETALIQVFSNLLANAVKFMPAGTTPKIEIWTEPQGDNVRIYIKDNGIGVPSEDREKIFQMFERLQPTSKYEGSGIGLTIVRRAVERMAGKIGVEPSDKPGTTFWLELKKGEPG
jgi:signal transduction histidine kinase